MILSLNWSRRWKAWKRNCDFRPLTGGADGELGREIVTSVSQPEMEDRKLGRETVTSVS